MSLTPRRTVRVPDDEWDAGHARARGRKSEGDNLTSVLRRLLAGYIAARQSSMVSRKWFGALLAL